MNSFFFETQKSVAVYMALGLFLAACSSDIAPRGNESRRRATALRPRGISRHIGGKPGVALFALRS